MLEKRVWPNLLFILFASLVCVALWQMVSSPSTSSGMFHVKTVYSLYSQNYTGSPYSTHQLPVTDYNQLIDLNFSFTILNLVCNESSLLLLVVVHSAPRNFAKRKTIRETWTQNSENIKVLFMLGMVDTSDLQQTLEDENRIYNDFIQGSFLDTYRNMTYKHVMIFKYVIYHCPQARYILKTDDDVFVNMPTMKNFLTVDLSPYGASNVLFCMRRRHPRVLRTYRSKWRVSFDEYPNRHYPPYCSGWNILYSPDVIFALYKEAQKSEYFWIDDIHITGTLIQKIHLTHTDIKSLVISEEDLNFLIDYSGNISRPFLYSGPNLKEQQIRALWKFVLTHSIPKSILKDVQIV